MEKYPFVNSTGPNHILNNDEQRLEPTSSLSIVQEAQDISNDAYLREEYLMEFFIVDGEVVDENVLPMGRKNSKKIISMKAPDISSSAFQEVQDIIRDVDYIFSLVGPTAPKK